MKAIFNFRNYTIVGIILVSFLGFRFYISHKNKKVNISTLDLRDGDVIFHTSLSSQSQAIQLATDSKYSHCGLIFYHHRKWQVLEAVEPVKYTDLEKWIKRGKNAHFIIKRTTKELNSSELTILKSMAESYLGKNYDLSFEWSDKKIYCSELIWKAYKKALNIEMGKLQKLSDFDFTQTAVQKKMKERYGNNIPKNETVISPQAVFESENLKFVY